MKEKEILDNLRSILKELNTSFEVDKLDENFDLFAYGALDSLIMIQYVVAIENHFHIHIENEDITYERFRNFGELKKVLISKYLKNIK